MATTKKVQKGGFPAKTKNAGTRVIQSIKNALTRIKASLKRAKKNRRPKVKPTIIKVPATQAERFIAERSATLQYAIDVLALAFILALLFMAVNHFAR